MHKNALFYQAVTHAALSVFSLLIFVWSYVRTKGDVSDPFVFGSAVCFTSCIALVIVSLFLRYRWFDSSRFSDADAVRPMEIVERLEQLMSQHSTVDENAIKLIVEEQIQRRNKNNESFQSFAAYFEHLSVTLEDKAAIADKKASILLDKGTAYASWGVVFYLLSIVAWQAVISVTEFKVQHIYGIASCTILFAFLEFLSAWFLRQYRHFVDTSTYLIKMKSIFDRFMLSFLIAKERGAIEQITDDKIVCGILEMLSADIKWPDAELWRRGDVNFAREAIESLSAAVNVLVSQGREKKTSHE